MPEVVDIGLCFRILGLSPSAPRADVKRAYYELVRKWHPDRIQDDEARRISAEERLKQINVAYGRIEVHLDTKAEQTEARERGEQRDWSRTPDGWRSQSASQAYARAAGAKFGDDARDEEADRQRAAELFETGKGRFYRGEWKDAVSALLQSVCLVPAQTEAHLMLGMAYRMLRMPAKAVTAFKQAIRFNLDSEEAYVQLAETSIEIGAAKDGAWQCAQFLRRFPSSAPVLALFGACYRRLNKLPQAIEALERAIRFDVSHGRAYYELGEIRLQLNDVLSAREMYAKLQELDDDLAVRLLLSIIKRDSALATGL